MVIMREIARRLQIARENAGYKTKSEAARALGISVQTVISHELDNENGRVPKLKYLRRYAEKYGVTVQWLEGGEVLPPTKPATPGKTEPIRVIGECQAGHWLEHDPLAQIGNQTIEVPIGGDNMIAVRIKDDSMDEVLKVNDLAVVATTQQARDGDIVLAQRSRSGLIETTIKRLVNRALRCESTNPAWTTEVPLDDKAAAIKIIGRVVGLYRQLA